MPALKRLPLSESTTTPLHGSGPKAVLKANSLLAPAQGDEQRLTIGGKPLDRILVDLESVQGHLALLNAFSKLKLEVMTGSALDGSVLEGLKGDSLWTAFLGLAVERFDAWCASLEALDMAELTVDELLPPLDVLMVWHTYLLNPRWYAEDAMRLPACGKLYELGNLVFGRDMHHFQTLLSSPTSEKRQEVFKAKTGMPFCPFVSARKRKRKTVKCPKCRLDMLVPYVTPDGTGYLQGGFAYPCSQDGCGMQVTRDALCARKLAEGLVRTPGGHPLSYLPGTYFTALSHASRKHGAEIVQCIQALHQANTEEEMISSILEGSGCSTQRIAEKMGYGNSVVGRVLRAHESDKAYSVELVAAVQRQGSFIQKMSALGWTNPSFPDSPRGRAALQRATLRYHSFLDLMASPGKPAFLVPTLDIDLLWHTHQLFGKRYREDCERYVGRFVDHDDNVEEGKLSNSFQNTSSVWKERFGEEYTICLSAPKGMKSTAACGGCEGSCSGECGGGCSSDDRNTKAGCGENCGGGCADGDLTSRLVPPFHKKVAGCGENCGGGCADGDLTSRRANAGCGENCGGGCADGDLTSSSVIPSGTRKSRAACGENCGGGCGGGCSDSDFGTGEGGGYVANVGTTCSSTTTCTSG